jgi:hypothetical protein
MSSRTKPEERSIGGGVRVRYRKRGGTNSENRRPLHSISSQLNHVKYLHSFF